VIPIFSVYIFPITVFYWLGGGATDKTMLIVFSCVYVCAFMVFYGVSRLRLAGKARRLTQMARDKHGGRIPVKTAALYLDVPLKRFYREIGRMFASRYITGASIDAVRKEIVFDYAGAPDDDPEGGTIFVEAKNMNSLPAVIFVGIWLNAYAFFDLANLKTLIIVAVASIAAAVAVFVLTPRSRRLIESDKAEEKAALYDTGDASFDEKMNAAAAQLAELEKLSRRLSASNIGGQLQTITDITREILDYLKANPGKIKDMRQFFGYCLPTSVSFFREYAQLTAQAVKTDNIVSSIKSIEEFAGRIQAIFKNELDNLYMNKAVDITAEIAVMQGIMHGIMTDKSMKADAPAGESPDNP
jgi:5-bromo-4-chloroindolyl phosphate hydrolysis protein